MTKREKILRSIITETLIRVESELQSSKDHEDHFKVAYWTDYRMKIIGQIKQADEIKAGPSEEDIKRMKEIESGSWINSHDGPSPNDGCSYHYDQCNCYNKEFRWAVSKLKQYMDMA